MTSKAVLRRSFSVALISILPLSGAAMGAAGVPDLSGTYWATEYYPKIQVLGGGDPPLNDAGKVEYQKNRAGLRDGSIEDSARKYCLPDGIPRMLATPYPFEVFQAPADQVTFVHELNNVARVVGVDKPAPSNEDIKLKPTYDGYSSAHYDGDTLVIKSVGFNDQTFIDSSGLPHSNQLTTTERIRRIGDQLEDVVTIHDPVFYTKDWQSRFVYQRRPGLRLRVDSCDDKHRDLSQVKGVAEVRALRAEGKFP